MLDQILNVLIAQEAFKGGLGLCQCLRGRMGFGVSREERLLFHRFNDRVANTRDKSFLELAGQKLTKALRAIAATSR
jgi:hypothetical protein